MLFFFLSKYILVGVAAFYISFHKHIAFAIHQEDTVVQLRII